MDDRLKDIREGAGLEESKLNEVFIDWLNKWGNRILWVALIVLALYVGNIQLTKWRKAKIDRAFQEYQEILALDPTPEALLDIAQRHGGARGVPTMARLQAADLYLESVRLGLVPGATVGDDGSVLTEEDLLSEDQKAWSLDRADGLYGEVFDASAEDLGKVIFAIDAAFGKAAVAETRFDRESARSWYERVIALGEAHGYDEAVSYARERIEALDDLTTMPVLYASADLPESARVSDDPLSGLNIDDLLRQAQESSEADVQSPQEPANEQDGGGDGSDTGDAPGDEPGGDGGADVEQEPSGSGDGGPDGG